MELNTNIAQADRPTVTSTKKLLSFLNRKSDIAVVLFSVLLFVNYCFQIHDLQVPPWDGAVYLSNAQSWLIQEPLPEPFRPPLLSWIIAGIWLVTGEHWETVKYVPAFFAVGAGAILYLALRKEKGGIFAFSVTVLTMVNAQLFGYSTQLLTESLSLFFLVLTFYLLKSKEGNCWFLAGVTIGLTFAARYPIVLQAIVIFLVEFLFIRKSFTLASKTILGTGLVFAIVVFAVHAKAGFFEMALDKDTHLSIWLSAFFVENSIKIWGLPILLVPVALMLRKTYTNIYNYTFIFWFLISFIFWSANVNNHDFRYAIQFMPAAYYLAILALENIWFYLNKIHSTLNLKSASKYQMKS